MRTLTLGVLIVAGGTLAALPFRRYQAIPDASSAPAQVTGPTQSLLESTAPAAVAGDNRAAGTALDLASEQSSFVPRAYPASDDRRTLRVNRSPQRAEIPLTYEDLAMPIDQPAAVQERFNATAPIRALQLEQERTALLVMPAIESLAATEVEQIHQVAKQFAEARGQTASVTGSLASARESGVREAGVERLPAAQRADRPRHWIRQPD